MLVHFYIAGLACGIERVQGEGWEVGTREIETSTLGGGLRPAPQLCLVCPGDIRRRGRCWEMRRAGKARVPCEVIKLLTTTDRVRNLGRRER